MGHSYRVGLITFALLASVHIASALEGVPSVKVVIEGTEYNVPLANKEYAQDVYMLKKALEGDHTAFEMLIGTEDEKWMFIGDYEPLWAKITRYKVEVVDPNTTVSDNHIVQF